ncbi:MAG TPA: hypothetical protein PK529_10545 [Verrucomicrobiales bacterium]|nr:hypothetical protein [Verrucomicrobiales bacterium]
MQTLAQLAKALNRSNVEISGLQSRFELPVFPGAGYSVAYLAFLRIVVQLRILNVSEEKLRDLWHIEKKLLQLLHADTTGSSTWFLDSCGVASNPNKRLLLSNYELGVDLEGSGVQLGLDFGETPAELFSGEVMGEDVLRILNDYRHLYAAIRSQVKLELPKIRAAIAWAKNRMV